MPYQVYLPPGYDADPAQRYPVLYMLHGLGGDHQQWLRYGLFETATDLIQQGDIPPMIIVTPEGQRGYWVDHADKGPRFGTYIAGDLVAAIDREYRTLPDREDRAIGGMSMGGHGALQLALNHPDQFGVIGAHSVALRTKQQAFHFFGDEQYFRSHDPVSLCRDKPARLKQFDVWIDIGDNDPWYGAAEAFHRQLQEADVPHAWNVFRGGHEEAYWTDHAADYLRFYGQALQSPS